VANTLYNRGLAYAAQEGWTNIVMRVLLVRDTSTYTPDKDHDYLTDFTGNGGVEVTASGYARDTIESVTSTLDDTNDLANVDGDNLDFGEVVAGQGWEAALVYIQIGGDDTTPANDILLAWFDTDMGITLPADFMNGSVTLSVANIFQLMQGT